MTGDTSRTSRDIDVSELPSTAFGSRSLAWWATVLLICIEGTAFLLIIAAYLYYREQNDPWPPEGPLHPTAATVGTLTLLVSVVPMLLAHDAALKKKLFPMRVWLATATALSLAALVARGYEFAALPFKWDSTAYASVVWTTLGLHTFETLAGVLENVVLTAMLFRRLVEEKRSVDVETNALFWLFIVAIWIPIYAVFYVEGLPT